MKRILESYFLTIHREASSTLKLVALLPVALAIWAIERLSKLSEEMRERASRRLLNAALWMLPSGSGLREQALELLRDWRKYERYEGYCLFAGSSPLSFADWRKEMARVGWLQKKMRAVA